MKKSLALIFTLTIFSQVLSQSNQEVINWPDEPLPIYHVIEIVPKPEYITEFINAVKVYNDKWPVEAKVQKLLVELFCKAIEH